MDNDPEPVQEQKKEKPLNELLTSSIVDIYVGQESTHWPLHERLLCYHSPFMANVLYKDDDKSSQSRENKSSGRKNKSYGFPEEEDHTFTLLVGWLYSRTVPPPSVEKDTAPLLDLYLLAEKLQIDRLCLDIVNAIREYYHNSSSYPGLRRVQYIYANTDEDNAMREMMVSCVARQLATTEKIPAHWVSALQRNGQLAVDIIRSIQRWNIEERSIPDVRDGSVSSGRGRQGKGGFSAILREGDSLETEATGMTGMTGSLSLGSNLGVESVTSANSDELRNMDNDKRDQPQRESVGSGQIEPAGKQIAVGGEAPISLPPHDILASYAEPTKLDHCQLVWTYESNESNDISPPHQERNAISEPQIQLQEEAQDDEGEEHKSTEKPSKSANTTTNSNARSTIYTTDAENEDSTPTTIVSIDGSDNLSTLSIQDPIVAAAEDRSRIDDMFKKIPRSDVDDDNDDTHEEEITQATVTTDLVAESSSPYPPQPPVPHHSRHHVVPSEDVVNVRTPAGGEAGGEGQDKVETNVSPQKSTLQALSSSTSTTPTKNNYSVQRRKFMLERQEIVLLLVLWTVYFGWWTLYRE